MTKPNTAHDGWALDPEITFLNHGSFGACPRLVLDAQQDLRGQMEAQPVDFLVRRLPGLLDDARAELGTFLGADPDGLAFVSNATAGVNSVLASFPLDAGDEVIVTDHAYNACRNALEYWAGRAEARVRVATVPFPIVDPAEAVEAILAEVGPRTVLALVDHITSATALVLPIDQIARELHDRGIELLVDGAHAPGMVPLDLDALGVEYYVGNCHKWVCAPKGAGFLHVRHDKRDAVRPAIISHGANVPTKTRSRFRHEFDWIGTTDPTPWLCVPVALSTMAGLFDGGWPALMQANRELVLEGRSILLDALGEATPGPDSMIGSIATVPLPDGPFGPRQPLYADPLQNQLWAQHRIEVPIGPWPAPPRRNVRISAQHYNQPADYERLAVALVALLERES